MVGAVRNFANVQFASLRVNVDPLFNTLHDELEAAYYQFWKAGLSKPWLGFDVQAAPAESKALFDRLHGALWWAHDIVLNDENDKLAQRDRYEADKINPVVNPEAPQNQQIRKRDYAKQLWRNASGFDAAALKAALQARGLTFSTT